MGDVDGDLIPETPRARKTKELLPQLNGLPTWCKPLLNDALAGYACWEGQPLRWDYNGGVVAKVQPLDRRGETVDEPFIVKMSERRVADAHTEIALSKLLSAFLPANSSTCIGNAVEHCESDQTYTAIKLLLPDVCWKIPELAGGAGGGTVMTVLESIARCFFDAADLDGPTESLVVPTEGLDAVLASRMHQLLSALCGVGGVVWLTTGGAKSLQCRRSTVDIFREYDILNKLEKHALHPSSSSEADQTSVFGSRLDPILEPLHISLGGTSFDAALDKVRDLRGALKAFQAQPNAQRKWRALRALSHGDLHASSILVDAAFSVFLIDYESVGEAPVLCDWVSLLMSLIFECCVLPVTCANLNDIVEHASTSSAPIGPHEVAAWLGVDSKVATALVEALPKWVSLTQPDLTQAIHDLACKVYPGPATPVRAEAIQRLHCMLVGTTAEMQKAFQEAGQLSSFILEQTMVSMDAEQTQQKRPSQGRLGEAYKMTAQLFKQMRSSFSELLAAQVHQKSVDRSPLLLLIPMLEQSVQYLSSPQMAPWQKCWVLRHTAMLAETTEHFLQSVSPNATLNAKNSTQPFTSALQSQDVGNSFFSTIAALQAVGTLVPRPPPRTEYQSLLPSFLPGHRLWVVPCFDALAEPSTDVTADEVKDLMISPNLLTDWPHSMASHGWLPVVTGWPCALSGLSAKETIWVASEGLDLPQPTLGLANFVKNATPGPGYSAGVSCMVVELLRDQLSIVASSGAMMITKSVQLDKRPSKQVSEQPTPRGQDDNSEELPTEGQATLLPGQISSASNATSSGVSADVETGSIKCFGQKVGAVTLTKDPPIRVIFGPGPDVEQLGLALSENYAGLVETPIDGLEVKQGWVLQSSGPVGKMIQQLRQDSMAEGLTGEPESVFQADGPYTALEVKVATMALSEKRPLVLELGSRIDLEAVHESLDENGRLMNSLMLGDGQRMNRGSVLVSHTVEDLQRVLDQPIEEVSIRVGFVTPIALAFNTWSLSVQMSVELLNVTQIADLQKKPSVVFDRNVDSTFGDIKVSLPYKYGLAYPVYSRLTVLGDDCSDPEAASAGGREGTVEAINDDGQLTVQFDNASHTCTFLPSLTNQRPAGVYRYAPGQALVVNVGPNTWVDAIVVEPPNGGSRHLLDIQGHRSGRRQYDLNSFNHSPAWLSAAEFDTRARQHAQKMLAKYGSVLCPVTGTRLDVMLQQIGAKVVWDQQDKDGGNTGTSLDHTAFHYMSGVVEPSARRHEGVHPAPCFLVIGEVKSGKMCLLRMLCSLCARHCSDVVPLMISAADLGEAMRRYRLRGDLIDEYLRNKLGEASEQYLFLRQTLHSRRAVIFVQRVDDSGDMRARIERYLMVLAHMGYRIVATAKSHGRALEPFIARSAANRFTVLELQPLPESPLRWGAKARLGGKSSNFLASLEKMAPYPNALVNFPKLDEPVDPVDEYDDDEQKERPKFSCEPLLYTLLVGEAACNPVKKGETRSPSSIMENIVTLLCGRIEQSAACNAHQASSAPKDMRILLEHLAEMLQVRKQKVFGNEDVRAFLSASPELLNIWVRLRTRVKSGHAPILSTQSREDGEVLFRFSHPFFQEFLLACHQARYWNPTLDIMGQNLEEAVFDRSWGHFFLWFFDRQEIQVTLDLRNLRMLGWKTSMLSKFLECTSGVQKLFLKSSSIGVRGTATLCEALATNSSVAYLELEDIALGNSSTEALIMGLSNNVGLRYLDLTGNGIGPPGALGIAKAVRGNTVLEHLDIKDNRIGDQGTHYICKSLIDNKALRHLDVSGNKIGEDGICDLASVLLQNEALCELAIRDNTIGDFAIGKIAEAMVRENARLQRLEIGNPAGGSAGKMTIKGLINFWPRMVKSHLTYLDLASHVLGTTGMGVIDSHSWGLGNLTHLNLAGNRIGGAGAAHLTHILSGNTTLLNLNLSWNDINDSGAFELCESIETSAIQHLNLSNNFITMDGARALIQSQSRSKVKALNLDYNRKVDQKRLMTFMLGVVNPSHSHRRILKEEEGVVDALKVDPKS
jgi:Ran GTPase-activating protein (RanGAP) involved in mRNA processing and transport